MSEESIQTSSPQNIALTLWRDFFTRNRENKQNRQEQQELIMTVQNQRINNPWGDELREKPDGITRIYSINVNGINIDRRGGKFNSICAAMKEIQGDIFCGQEHNLDVTQPRVRRTLYDTAQQHWQRLRLIIGTTPIQYSTAYKPGGTLMLATGDITGRILAQEQDKWGRWAIQEFQGRATRKLAVVTHSLSSRRQTRRVRSDFG
jgi:hypothetical protein